MVHWPATQWSFYTGAHGICMIICNKIEMVGGIWWPMQADISPSLKSAQLLAVTPVAYRGGQTVSFEKRQWSCLLPVSRLLVLGRWWPHWFHWTQLSQFTANNFIRVKLSRPCLALLHPALSSGQPIFRFLIQEGKCILTTKCAEKASSLSNILEHEKYCLNQTNYYDSCCVVFRF